MIAVNDVNRYELHFNNNNNNNNNNNTLFQTIVHMDNKNNKIQC